ncbi:hypothetical protein N431DRAFT_548513 [Stipitochalara longipes BDJ]|nr:hypothetical protein N431DRAFT_548513 [Stipitochalara longipes BDJ]
MKKRTASQASLTSTSRSSEQEAKRLSRMQLEAIAQVALREGLSREQVAYEQWVDRQPIGEVVSWEEMGIEGRVRWCLEFIGGCPGAEVECGKGGIVGEEGRTGEQMIEDDRGVAAMGDLGESRWRAVRTGEVEQLAVEEMVIEQEESEIISSGMLFFVCSRKVCFIEKSSPTAEPAPTTEPSLISEPTPIHPFQRPYRAGYRVWTPTTTEDSIPKNKPQCPPCARLKRTWTRCRGGPPCIECQHRGLSAEQCQSYDLLNRSRKNRLKKQKEDHKKSEIEIHGECDKGGQKDEQTGEDATEDGKEAPGGTADLKLLEAGENLEAEAVAQ